MLAAALALSTTAGASAILVADAALSATSPTGSHPDEALIQAGGELAVLWAAERDLLARFEWDAPEVVAAEARCDPVIARIAVAKASTLVGLRVKAEACAYCNSGDPFDEESLGGDDTVMFRLIRSLIGDLLALDATARA